MTSFAHLREIAKNQSKKAAAKAQLNSKLKQPTIFNHQSVPVTIQEPAAARSSGFNSRLDPDNNTQSLGDSDIESQTILNRHNSKL